MKSKWILLILAVGAVSPVRAELRTERVSANTTHISRNGELLIVIGQTGTNRWSEYVYFKGKSVLLRVLNPKLELQVFFENSPIKISEDDTDNDGRLDRIELYEIVGYSKTIHDLLHIGPDDRLTPYSDEELDTAQQETEEGNRFTQDHIVPEMLAPTDKK